MKGSWVRVPFSAFFFCPKMPPDSNLTACSIILQYLFLLFFLETVFFSPAFFATVFFTATFFCSNLFCTFLLWLLSCGRSSLAVVRFLRCYCQFLRLFARCAGKYSHTQCRKLKGNGILSFIAVCLLAGLCPYDLLFPVRHILCGHC